jgi:hypothetical protein
VNLGQLKFTFIFFLCISNQILLLHLQHLKLLSSAIEINSNLSWLWLQGSGTRFTSVFSPTSPKIKSNCWAIGLLSNLLDSINHVVVSFCLTIVAFEVLFDDEIDLAVSSYRSIIKSFSLNCFRVVRSLPLHSKLNFLTIT